MRNFDPQLSPLARALFEGIPTFAALKTDGVEIEAIVAAFKAWDSAVDDNLISSTVKRLVTDPRIEIVRSDSAGNAVSQSLFDGAEDANPKIPSTTPTQRKLITAKECHRDRFQEKISLRQVYDLFYSGDLEGFRVGRSVLLYDDSIDAYIKRNRNADPSSKQDEQENPTTGQSTNRGQRPRSSEQGGFQYFHLPDGR